LAIREAYVHASGTQVSGWVGPLRIVSAFQPPAMLTTALRNRADGERADRTGPDDDVLIRHAYVAARGRGFKLDSGSVLTRAEDSGTRNLIAPVNRSARRARLPRGAAAQWLLARRGVDF
jgi:hypothetical protein